MANDFTNAQNVGVTTQATVYTAPVGKDSIVLELDIANTTASAVTVSAKIYDASATTFAHIVKDAPVPVGGALQVISGQKIILLAGDYVCVTASAACDVVCSVLEDVNPA
jgi:hypothetical protein|tara:strand:- start:69 stop:398 length:330 start_codon:yes stop_codon:yes gene_type:complete